MEENMHTLKKKTDTITQCTIQLCLFFRCSISMKCHWKRYKVHIFIFIFLPLLNMKKGTLNNEYLQHFEFPEQSHHTEQDVRGAKGV